MHDIGDPVGSRVSPPVPGDQVAAACYRVREGAFEILLVRSSGGRRIFPKGKIERGEHPSDGALREAREEAGIRSAAVEREPLTQYWHTRKGRRRGVLVTVYLARVDTVGKKHEEGRRPRWYRFDEALERLERHRTPEEAAELHRVLRAVRTHLEALPDPDAAPPPG